MPNLIDLFVIYPFWSWIAVGAVLLVIEIATGTGYLLWPAASAGVVAIVAALVHPELSIDILVFALLTIASTVVGRRYMPTPFRHKGPDINDRAGRLIGKVGEIVRPFDAGLGRVFVDGSEWAAEVAEGDATPKVGARVEVVEVLGAARLKVRVA